MSRVAVGVANHNGWAHLVTVGLDEDGPVVLDRRRVALISPDLPWRQNGLAFDKAFPQQDDLIVAVIDGATPELAEQAAAKMAAELQKHPDLYPLVRRPDAARLVRFDPLAGRT